MKPVLTAAETQALDRATEARGTSIEALMERAGLAVARAASRVAGGAYGRRAVVVCGKGNNGGDGLVAARYLARWGMGVTVALLAEPDSYRGPASANLVRLEGTGVRVRPFDAAGVERELRRADVAIDAVFGSGFRGRPEGPHAAAIQLLDGRRAPVVAVDIPSGVEGDTGAVPGPAVGATATVTFGAPKVGDVLYPGAARAGDLEVADIGFPPDLVASDLLLVEPADVRSLLPARDPDTHKRRSGVVMVVGGSRTMTGAPRLVAQGAYRAGAGLVRVAVPEGVLPVVQSGLPEATFLPLPQGPAGSAAEAAWELIEPNLDGVGAVGIGPGLSTDEETPAFVRRLVRESPVPVVVDADAINAFAGHPGDLSRRASDVVITPHAGEFARLFDAGAADVRTDPVAAVRKAAAETRCVVLLKGTRSLVAAPDGAVRINPTGTPVLATGGTGDVLTGVIATLLARGLSPHDAATVGAYVHGVAGGVAGERLGEGTMSSDVAAALPEAMARVRGPG